MNVCMYAEVDISYEMCVSFFINILFCLVLKINLYCNHILLIFETANNLEMFVGCRRRKMLITCIHINCTVMNTAESKHNHTRLFLNTNFLICNY